MSIPEIKWKVGRVIHTIFFYENGNMNVKEYDEVWCRVESVDVPKSEYKNLIHAMTLALAQTGVDNG